jgi:hypothetical protein
MTRNITFLLIVCFVVYLAAGNSAFAQKPRMNPNVIHLSIVPMFGANALVIGDSAFQAKNSRASENVYIDVLKFYISRIQFLQKEAVVLEEPKSFHLIDAAAEASFHLAIANKRKIRFDAVRFHLGIDSTTSVSGALGGDLDPTKGMYWTWQSGYINVKCEGKSEHCLARNKEFQLHLGGYREPFYCLQTVTFPLHEAEAITIQFDAERFLSQIDMATHHHIMSPNAQAVRLLAIAAGSFSIVNSNIAK